ncbi:MAG: NEAT domain-containing protein [Clostridiales bacterium]|nr:NEAT domain-containing protein [Clostridiales bacterium]
MAYYETSSKSDTVTTRLQNLMNPYSDDGYSELEIDTDGAFTITFDVTSYEDMVFGKTVKILTGYDASSSKPVTYTYGTLRLAESAVLSITLTDEETGIQFLTTTANVSETDVLKVTEITEEDEDYEWWSGNLEGSTNHWQAWRIEVVTADGDSVALSNKGTLKIPIPDEYNTDTTTGIYPGTSAIVYETGTVKDGYVVIEPTALGEYGIQDKLSSSSTAESLEDGVYTVKWYLETESGSGISMSDNAFVKPATIVVKDGTVRLELTLQAVDVMGTSGYLSRAAISADGSEYTSGVITKYMTVDDELLTERWVSGYQIYYPMYLSEIYFILDQDHDGAYTMKFRIPIMDGLATIKNGGVGNSDKIAQLYIDYTTAEKVEEEAVTDASIGEALEAAIEVAEEMQAHWEEYDPAVWETCNLADLITAAKTAVNSEDTDTITTAYQNLQSAMETLTDNYLSAYACDAGLYTTDAALADDSDAVSEMRMLVNEDNTTKYRLYTDGVTALSYYDIETRSYVAATEETDGYSFVLDEIVGGSNSYAPRVYKSIAIKYMDSDGEEYNTWLNVTEFTEASDLDTSSLESILDEAASFLSDMLEDAGSYDATAITNLSTAIADGNTLLTQSADSGYMVIQSDIDEMVENIEAALEAAAGDVDLSELTAAIQSATTAYNEAVESGTYTPSSVAALKETIDSATALLTASPSNYQIAAMVKSLSASVSGLTAQVDKTELESVLATAKAIENNNYSGWDNLQTAIEQAEAVVDDGDASETEVSSMVNTLTIAISALDNGVDKDTLTSYVSQAEEQYEILSANGCDSTLLAYYQAAITAAKAVLNDTSATQTDVTKQETNLEKVTEAMFYFDGDGLADGVYEISAKIVQTDLESTSMADSAADAYRIVIEDGVATEVQIHFSALTASLGTSTLTGHLGWIKYYANYNSTTVPSSHYTATAATVLSYYGEDDRDDFWADYMNGVEYPEWVSIPLETYTEDGETYYQTQYWLQVFVPVMEYITTGSGTQKAVLQLDFDTSTWTQVSGVEGVDKTSLEEMIAELEELYDEVSSTATTTSTVSALSETLWSASVASEEDTVSVLAASLTSVSTDNSEENIVLLAAAITAAYYVDENLNVTQEYVDKMVTALTATEAIFEAESVESNKEALAASIEEAEEALANENVTYTEDSEALLEWILDAAKLVYDNDEADQDQVSFWNNLLQTAISNLTAVEGDKTELAAALALAETYLENSKYYSSAEIAVLQTYYDAAMAVYEDSTANQTAVDQQTATLTAYMESMTVLDTSSVVKQGLHAMIATASNLAGRETLYTEETLNALIEAIAAAEAVYDDDAATQDEVNAQASALLTAILNLKAAETTTSSSSSDSSSSSSSSSDSSSDSSDDDDDDDSTASTTLDITNLEDGVYAVTGYMYKTDKETLSMSNDAIVHTIKLTVSDGVYYLTMDFKGLTISSSLGYLSDLKYFASGYTTTNGVPKGTTIAVTVDSYQTDEDGNLVSDTYGTNYPDIVTFPLISEALDDGWVPLQVYVPIMEAIASGTGTQAVYLYLDWTTIVSTTSDDSSFDDDSTNSTTSDDDDDDDDSTTTSSDDDDSTTSTLSSGSTLGDSTLSGSTLGSSTLSGSSTSSDSTLGSSSLDSSSLTGSSLSSTSTTKTGDEANGMRAWIALICIGGFAAAVALAQRRKGRKNA